VTPERAVEINSVVAMIAASAVAAHEAAGEPSPIVLVPMVQTVVSNPKSTDKLLEGVLGALPEPKSPGQGRRKPRRASSATEGVEAKSSDSSENTP
jgi:ribonuclease E